MVEQSDETATNSPKTISESDRGPVDGREEHGVGETDTAGRGEGERDECEQQQGARN
jgi:hypothetical protein